MFKSIATPLLKYHIKIQINYLVNCHKYKTLTGTKVLEFHLVYKNACLKFLRLVSRKLENVNFRKFQLKFEFFPKLSSLKQISFGDLSSEAAESS